MNLTSIVSLWPPFGYGDLAPVADTQVDILETGMHWLTDQLISHSSQRVTYSRAGASVTLRATLGHKMLRMDDQFGGTRIEWTDADFLIRASSLVLPGSDVRTIPRVGDRIRHRAQDGTHIYEVSKYGGEPHWRWADAYRRMIRVHAKLITTELTS